MANEQNLIPFDDRTESEQRNIRSAGGKASGAARRRKKSLKAAMRQILDMTPTTEMWNELAAMGFEPDDITNQTVMLVGLFQSAAEGNFKAVREIRSILGETLETPLEAQERKQRIRKTKAEADRLNGVDNTPKPENNLFEVIAQSTGEELDTSAISEIESPAEPGYDLVEPTGV